MPRLLALLLLASLSAGASAATAAAADGGSRRTGRLGVVVSGGSGGSIEAAHDSRMVAADMGASMAPAAVAGHMEDALPGDGERVDTAASDKPCAGAGGVSDAVASSVGTVGGRKPPKKMQFRTPKGLFIQERASKQLPGPGQHFSFGALKDWKEIHTLLEQRPGAKLLLLVRHGQAISNWLGDELGPDEWFNWESKCVYDNGTDSYSLFDAELTEKGIAEGDALNSMLASGGWWPKLTNGQPVHAVVSPLSRCLQTMQSVMKGLKFSKVDVEENIRETLGEDTCDARRSVSSPKQGHGAMGICDFDLGLRDKYKGFKFNIVDEAAREKLRSSRVSKEHERDKVDGLGFGMISDDDQMWTVDREGQKHQVKRAVRFMKDVFEFIDDRVAFVMTHSGTVRSLLLAVGREPYRPQNTELVPVVVEEIRPAPSGDDDDDAGDDGRTMVDEYGVEWVSGPLL
uniref:Uncharacterized protein n=1 Tax=Chlamydomonas euryale TaxID=1486919 RepID=A0A7R9V4S6_9CHLO